MDLFSEVKLGSYDRVRERLQAGADANVVYEKLGQNLAFFAAARPATAGGCSRRRFLELLVDEHGVDAASEDRSMKQTPLYYAAREGDAECCAYLIGRRCNPDHVDAIAQSPLFYAAKNGHQACAELLLSRQCVADRADSQGRSPLFYAASGGHVDLLQWLVRHHADTHRTDTTGKLCLFHTSSACAAFLLEGSCNPNHQDADGRTALFSAAMTGDAKRVRLLVDHGASVNHTDKWGWTCLFHAAKGGHIEVCELLGLELGVDIGFRDNNGLTARAAAEAYNKRSAAAALERAEKRLTVSVKKAAVVTAGASRKSASSATSTAAAAAAAAAVVAARDAAAAAPQTAAASTKPLGLVHQLSCAVQERPLSVVRALLDAGANPASVTVPRGQNLIFLAASRPKAAREVCELLVDHKVDPTAVDTQLHQTPLFFAVRNHPSAGGLECARYLIRQRCNADHVDVRGQTPIFYAAQRVEPHCAEALVAAGANVNVTDSIAQTAAFYAASSGAVQSMRALLSARADATAQDAHGQTALFLASNLHCVELLVEYNCNVNHHDKMGRTALFSAASNGFHDVTRALVKLRCDVNDTDVAGETCLFRAAQAKDAATVCRILLQEFGADASRKDNHGATAADAVVAPAVKELLARYGAVPARKATRKRCPAGSTRVDGIGGASSERTSHLVERAPRRRCVLMFEDPNMPRQTIVPGSPEYLAALRSLVVQCPWLRGWASAPPV